ncbi:MAG: glycosyltransferase family 9 protein [Thioalkalispiraceae bacterium]|jgi:ADP-heptose:LPS heptosyltransferase
MKIWSWKRNWIKKGAHQKAAQLDFSNVRRIAVLKHAALGDLVLTRPFLITLREYFPDAEITLSVARHYMNGIPEDLVDRIHIVQSKKNGASLWRRWKELRSLGEQDILFDISAVSRTFWLSKITKAKLKIGYKHRFVHRLIYDIAVERTAYKFEAETFMDQLLVLGLQYKWPLEFALQPDSSPIEGPYILYFPTASVDYKAWEFHRFASLINQLHARYPQYKHVLLSGIAEWEKKICDKVEALIEDKQNFLRINGSDETCNIVGHAALLVANDTGIRNMAIAYNTPTVCVFMATLPFTYAPRFGLHEIVFKTLGGQPEVDQVYDACCKILTKLDS